MKVAFVSQPWSRLEPPVLHADSIALWTYHVARRMAAASANVTIYATRGPGQRAVQRAEGVCYRRFSTVSDLRGWHRACRLAVRLALPSVDFDSAAFHVDYALRVALDVRRRGYDVVHVHNFSQYVPIIRALNPGVRIVLHMHCEWLSQLPAASVYARLRGVDRVVVCSHHILRCTTEALPRLAGHLSVLPNGVDFTALQGALEASVAQPFEEVRPTALFVGRITPEKGLHTLLDAFAKVILRIPDAQLRVVGPDATTPRAYIVDRSTDPHVRALARFYPRAYVEHLRCQLTPSLAAHVSFEGEVPHADLGSWYQRAHLLVNPSLSESFGMSLVEGMASGLPVVATRVGGMVDIVEHGVNGLLVAPEMPDALADALCSLLSNCDTRYRMRKAAVVTARGYAWDTVAKQTLALYRDIADGAPVFQTAA